MGGLAQSTGSEYEASLNITVPLVNQIVAQTLELTGEAEAYELQRRMCRVKNEGLREKSECEKFTSRKDAESYGASQ